MKLGAMGSPLAILPETDLERIYNASLDLLLDPGFYSESDLFLDIFAKGGAAGGSRCSHDSYKARNG